MICIYITYTMLPIRLQEAILGGILISVSHVTVLLFLNKVVINSMVSYLFTKNMTVLIY